MKRKHTFLVSIASLFVAGWFATETIFSQASATEEQIIIVVEIDDPIKWKSGA